jgi:hypothetical protein
MTVLRRGYRSLMSRPAVRARPHNGIAGCPVLLDPRPSPIVSFKPGVPGPPV